MLDLDETIKTQDLFCKQVQLCTNLLDFYRFDSELFKSTFSPRFEKAYGFKPYENADALWEYCDWLSSILTGHWSNGKYPIIVKKGKTIVVDYVSSKKKGHDPIKKVIPAVYGIFATAYVMRHATPKQTKKLLNLLKKTK